MADPITKFDGTENGIARKAIHNDNLDARLDLDTRTVTAATYTVDHDDECIFVDPTSNAVTITLLPIATRDGKTLVIIALNVTNTVTIDGDGAETINGSATKTIGTAGRRVDLVPSTSSNWRANYSDALP